MATVYLKNGDKLSFDRVVVKENGWAIGLGSTGKPEKAFPGNKIEEIAIDDNVYTDSYLHEEEYGETRDAHADEPGEMVTEFQNERRIEIEYHFE